MTYPPIPFSDAIPRRVSPDGSVVVCFEVYEPRMSVVLHPPVVYRARDGVAVLSCGGTALDGFADTTFPAPNQVRLPLRLYPNGSRVAYDLVVDVEAETFGIGGEPPTRPLSEIGDAIPSLRPEVDVDAALRAGTCPKCGGPMVSRRRAWQRLLGAHTAHRCERCGRAWYRRW